LSASWLKEYHTRRRENKIRHVIKKEKKYHF